MLTTYMRCNIHGPMQYANNQNTLIFCLIENDVSTKSYKFTSTKVTRLASPSIVQIGKILQLC